jgi:hypothetical protein
MHCRGINWRLGTKREQQVSYFSIKSSFGLCDENVDSSGRRVVRSFLKNQRKPDMTDSTDNISSNQTIASGAYPILLMTETEDEFASLCKELEQDIQPMDFIERMYVKDIAILLWEIVRLRRFKTAIINNAFRNALQNFLRQFLFEPAFPQGINDELEADALAYEWFQSEKAKSRVAKLLRQFQLDESSIEAEAFRLVSSDIDRMDRMLTLAEVRRDKALRNIAVAWRCGFGRVQSGSWK